MRYPVTKVLVPDTRGFGMIQVLVLAGIVSVLLMAISSMIGHSQKASHGISKTMIFDELASAVQQGLVDSNGCKSLLTQSGPNTVSLTGKSPLVIWVNGQTLDSGPNKNAYQNGAITITDIHIENVTGTPPDVRADFVISANLQGTDPSPPLGSPVHTAAFKQVAIQLNGTNQISRCGGASGTFYALSTFWSGGTSAPKSYPQTCLNPNDLLLGGGYTDRNNHTVYGIPANSIPGNQTWICRTNPGGSDQALGDCFTICQTP